MLVAEIHGKAMPEVRCHEDYLTSTVFGHLRYLPPSIFWEDFFRQAKGLPNEHGLEKSLAEVQAETGILISYHKTLQIHFWANHPTLGEPDVLLHFSGGTVPPLVVLIEAKLWSCKSGTGESDQLVRYLRILDDLPALRQNLPRKAQCFLVYLTQRDSLDEIEETVGRLGDRVGDRWRLFRLRWQDIVQVAKRQSSSAEEPVRTILDDVAKFLQRRALEYFDGFRTYDWLPDIVPGGRAFYISPSRRFQGFTRIADLYAIEFHRGGWVQ
jgi:hypothetical protein